MKISDIINELNKRRKIFWTKHADMKDAIQALDVDYNYVLKQGGKTKVFKATLIGTCKLDIEEFQWAWRSTLIPKHITEPSRLLFNFGKTKKIKEFTTPFLTVNPTLIMINNSNSTLDVDLLDTGQAPISKYSTDELICLSGMQLKAKAVVTLFFDNMEVYLAVTNSNPILELENEEEENNEPEYNDIDVCNYIARSLNDILPVNWHQSLLDAKFDKENNSFIFRIKYNFKINGKYNTLEYKTLDLKNKKRNISSALFDLINIMPSKWESMRYTLQSDSSFETNFQYSDYVWRDAYQNSYLLCDMETDHLFYTLKMAWNQMVEEKYHIQPFKEYDFLGMYSNEYFKEGIYAIIKELRNREDLFDDFKPHIKFIIESIKKDGALKK